MAERRKNRKKKETESAEDHGKPSKDEYSVAKYMRQKLPLKKTSLLGHKVEYFIASKAIDCLLDSPWATKSATEDILFTTRESVVKFMDRMLQHKFFHRAKKIIVSKDSKKKKKEKEGEEAAAESGKEKKTKDEAEEKSKESEKTQEKKEADSAEKKKEKKKIKLDMHLEQLFIDGNEVYVWIYDPIPMRTWIIGMLMVAGAVLVCLFPLWPQIIRHYIYYLSVAAALFLVFIIGLVIVRLIVFVVVWAFTLGKHHFWLLPNLTEDVGFFESFWPLYHYQYKGGKAKDEDKGDDKDVKEKTEDTKENDEKEKTEDKKADDDDKSESSSDEGKKGDQANSESEHDSDEKTKTENGDNGFEILNAEEEVKES